LIFTLDTKKQTAMPRHRWEDIRMDWINLDQGRDNWLAFANEVTNLYVLLNAVNFLTG
jgi:hypothetical protein